APAAGVLSAIAAKDGETVAVGSLLGQSKAGAAAAAAAGAADKKQAASPVNVEVEEVKLRAQDKPEAQLPKPASATSLAPSVRKMAAESGIEPSTVPGTGKDGRITKGDMMAAIERAASAPAPAPSTTMQV